MDFTTQSGTRVFFCHHMPGFAAAFEIGFPDAFDTRLGRAADTTLSRAESNSLAVGLPDGRMTKLLRINDVQARQHDLGRVGVYKFPR